MCKYVNNFFGHTYKKESNEIVEICSKIEYFIEIPKVEPIQINQIIPKISDRNMTDIGGCYEGPCYSLFDTNFNLIKNAVMKSSYPGFERIQTKNNKTTIAPLFRKGEITTSEFCYYVAQEQRDIYDWYINILPRHYYAKKRGDGKLITLLHAKLDELKILNIDESDLIRTQGYINKLENCYLVKIPWINRNNVPSPIVSECYDYLRSKYLSPIRRKIYIRSNIFVNEESLISLLTKKGFDIIEGGILTEENISYISNCECLIVNYELWNILLCPPKCKVIQLSQHNIGKMLCQLRGLTLINHPILKSVIDINKFKSLI